MEKISLFFVRRANLSGLHGAFMILTFYYAVKEMLENEAKVTFRQKQIEFSWRSRRASTLKRKELHLSSR